MKNILLMLLILVGAGCRTQKVVSQQTVKDSTTTITYRPIKLEIKTDTLSDTLNLYKFTHTFNKAAVGAVIAQKRNGRTSYTIRKTSDIDFEVETVAAGKDTTVLVTDTTKRITSSTTKLIEQQSSLLGKLWQGAKDYVLISIVFLVLILVIVKRITG